LIVGTLLAWLVLDFLLYALGLLGYLFGPPYSAGRELDLVDAALFPLQAMAYFLGIPVWISIAVPAVPPLVATAFALRFRAIPGEKQPNPFSSVVLHRGLAVIAVTYMAVFGPIAWHFCHLWEHRTRVSFWRTMGALPEYRQGRLTVLWFGKGTTPPWDLITREPTLELLSFDDCLVTDKDIKHLVGLCNLFELHLNGTEVTDACIPDLMRIRALLNLGIRDTRVTAGGVERLQAKLAPNRIGYSARPRTQPTAYFDAIRDGNEFLARRDYTAAISAFTDAIRLDPSDSKACSLRATAYLLRGRAGGTRNDFDNAVADLTESIRLRPNVAALYQSRGIAYMAAGNDGNAICDFDEAISLNPASWVPYSHRARAHLRQAHWDKAIADCKEAITLNPKDSMAYSTRGVAFLKKGETDRAIADTTEAIRLGAGYAVAYDTRGSAYAKRGDLGKAIEDFTTAIHRDPKMAAAYKDRGDAYLRKGERSKAEEDFVRAKNLGCQKN
jgi:Flp pilus assembly protein TadD